MLGDRCARHSAIVEVASDTVVTPKSWTRKCLCLFEHGFWLLCQPILLKFGRSDIAQRRVIALAGIHFIQKAL